jgi:hypothetical protein
MFSSNTETGITATYQDGDNTIDLVVGTLNQDTTGTAATVTTAAQPAITSLGTLAADLFIGNNVGVVVGHTSQVTFGSITPEHQQHGTGLSGNTQMIVGWGDGQSRLYLGRSASATIGSYSILSDNDSVGSIFGIADDGTDLVQEIARQDFVVDDDDPQANAIGGSVAWATHTTSGTNTTAMVITSSQNVEIPNGCTTEGARNHGGRWQSYDRRSRDQPQCSA